MIRVLGMNKIYHGQLRTYLAHHVGFAGVVGCKNHSISTRNEKKSPIESNIYQLVELDELIATMYDVFLHRLSIEK